MFQAPRACRPASWARSRRRWAAASTPRRPTPRRSTSSPSPRPTSTRCCGSSPTACATCSTRRPSGRTSAARSSRKCCATSPRRGATSSAPCSCWRTPARPTATRGVGTKAAFDALTGPQIKAFHDRWYAPNNAVLVVAGDVSTPARALAQIRTRFESIPSRPVPAHAAARLRPLARTVLHRPTRRRTPWRWWASACRASTARISCPRSCCRASSTRRAARCTRWPIRARRSTRSGFRCPTCPRRRSAWPRRRWGNLGADPRRAARRLEAILSAYAEHGVPRELFESTRRQLIAGQEESRNSISALAADWGTTIALDREPSIAREQELIARVSLAEVNRVAKRYLDVRHAIVGELTPSADASQNAAPAPAQPTAEEPLAAQPPVTHLPAWAAQLVANVAPPPAGGPLPAREKLPNGMTLIVKAESISDSVFVFGQVKNSPALEEPAGKTGVAAVLGGPVRLRHPGPGPDRLPARPGRRRVAGLGRGGLRLADHLARVRARGRAAGPERAPAALRPADLLRAGPGARSRASRPPSTAPAPWSRAARRPLMLPAGDPELREPTVAELQALTLDDVKAYYAETLRPRPDHRGDGRQRHAAGRAGGARARVRGLARHGRPARDRAAPAPAQPLGRGQVAAAPPLPIGQDTVTFQQIVPLERTAPDVYPLLLGNAILGGGSIGPEQSRLFRDLARTRGWSTPSPRSWPRAARAISSRSSSPACRRTSRASAR